MAAHPESRMHAAAEENGAVDGRTAFIAAQRGDAAAQAVVDRYLDDLACGVANIVNIFFPEVIALSGGVANQGDALLVPLRERVWALAFAFVFFTYRPIRLPLWQDPTNGLYGLATARAAG